MSGSQHSGTPGRGENSSGRCNLQQSCHRHHLWGEQLRRKLDVLVNETTIECLLYTCFGFLSHTIRK